MAKSKFRIGDKVPYPHGRGLSIGEVTAVDPVYVTLLTKNGSETRRRIERVSPYTEGK